MKNLEVFTQSALLLKRNVLEQRSDYQIFQSDKNMQRQFQVKEDRMLSLNGEWLYKECDDKGSEIEEEFFDEYFIPRDYVPVNLPQPRNSGAYIKKVSVTEAQMQLEAFIHFKGINAAFYLWVNGYFVGFNKEATGTSELRITEYLEAGVNTFVMLVLNEEEDCAGIWEDIDLLFRSGDHIRDFNVKINVDKFGENAIVELELFYFEDPIPAEFILIDPNGNKMIKNKFTRGQAVYALPEPMLWSAETPNLYTLMITTAEETIVKEIPIYQSQLKDNGDFFINGTKVQLFGAKCSDVKGWKNYSLTKAEIQLQMMRMKQHNINAIVLTNVEYSEWLELQCYKFGIYLINTTGLLNAELIDWDDQEHMQEFKNAHLPITTVLKNKENMFFSITNNYDFKNIIDDVYIETEVFKGEEPISSEQLCLIDLNPKESQTLKLTQKPLEAGSYSVQISYRQLIGTMATKQDFLLGKQVIYVNL